MKEPEHEILTIAASDDDTSATEKIRDVVRTRGPHDSRFTFTSHESGDHAICLSTITDAAWGTKTHIRLYLDIVVGSTKPDREHDRTHVSELSGKLRDLNQKMADVRREQQYQREREANFRDLSEVTNSKAVWYSVAQIVVLVITCTWQLRHLKVRRYPAQLSFALTNFAFCRLHPIALL